VGSSFLEGIPNLHPAMRDVDLGAKFNDLGSNGALQFPLASKCVADGLKAYQEKNAIFLRKHLG
jgi:hypothetical protein